MGGPARPRCNHPGAPRPSPAPPHLERFDDLLLSGTGDRHRLAHPRRIDVLSVRGLLRVARQPLEPRPERACLSRCARSQPSTPPHPPPPVPHPPPAFPTPHPPPPP